MMSRHGPLVLVVLPLLLLFNGVGAQNDKVDQRQQDFNSNFRGPPLGENGFVGANPLPRPQGLVDLENFDDNLSPSDIFQGVDQTFNFANQLIHVTANTVLTSDSNSTTTPPPTTSKASLSSSASRVPAGSRRQQRAPFHPHLPLQQHEPLHILLSRSSNSITTETPTHLLSSFPSIVTENTTNISLESQTFQPSIPSNELSNHINSFSVSSSSQTSDGGLADADGFLESSAFKIFHGTEASVDAGSENLSTPEVPDDVLALHFDENQQHFPPSVVRGNRHPGHPGRPNRRPSRPLRRPIHQPFNGRPRLRNKPRRNQPSILSLLTG